MKNIGAKSREIDLIEFDESIDDELSFIAISDEDGSSSGIVLVLMIDGEGVVAGIGGGLVGDILEERERWRKRRSFHRLTVLRELFWF